MNKRRNTGSRLVAIASAVTLTITLLSACLILNAGAIDPTMTVGSWGLTSSFIEPVDLGKGQVWVGRDVASSDSDANNGIFNFTYYATGREYGEGEDLISGALVITDQFNNDYTFVADTANDKIVFILNGAPEEALPDGTGNYAYFIDAQTESVIFNTNNNTVTYTIPAEEMKTVSTESVSPTSDAINKLVFGVVLKDVTVAAQYVTNAADSCSYTFYPTVDNPCYPSMSSVYLNTPLHDNYGPPLSIISGAGFVTIGDVSTFNLILVMVSKAEKYGFYPPDDAKISSDATADKYSAWIVGGTYTFYSWNGYSEIISRSDRFVRERCRRLHNLERKR